MLSEQIASQVISLFSSRVDLKGRPTVRSNGVKEWTVLCGIVAVFPDSSLETVVITTGVKALPDEQLSRSHGLLLHDTHAEILAIRGFNLFVIEECLNSKSAYMEASTDPKFKYKLKGNIKFAMYVSEVPCGDASLEQLAQGTDTEEPWSYSTELTDGVLRGREDFLRKGKVRTKPGRRDSPVTLSKSCSDKLTIKQYTSLLNSIVSSFVEPLNFYLRYLVLPDYKLNDASIQRCFKERLDESLLDEYLQMYRMKRFEVLGTSQKHEFEREDGEAKIPSNKSLVYIPRYDFNESIVNGVKEGSYSKKLIVRKDGESVLSRRGLFRRASSLTDLEHATTYTEWKNINLERVRAKKSVRAALGGWCPTYNDDFDI